MSLAIALPEPTVLSSSGDPETRLEEIAGKQYIFIGSLALLGFAIGEIIASGISISYSYGYYIGAVYTGIVSFIVGLDGLRVRSRYDLQIFAGLSGIGFAMSLVGAAVAATNYNFVSTIEACATTTSSSYSLSCGFNSVFACSGDENGFAAAAACESSYDVNNHGSENDHCSCILTSSSNTGDCYNFKNFNNCDHLTNSLLAIQIHVAYAFSVLCLLACLFLFIISLLSLCIPHIFHNHTSSMNEVVQNHSEDDNNSKKKNIATATPFDHHPATDEKK